MEANRDKLEPLPVSHCLNVTNGGALQKELHASPLSSHAPGPGMGETEADMAESGEASVRYYCVLTLLSSWSVTHAQAVTALDTQHIHQAVVSCTPSKAHTDFSCGQTLNGTIQGREFHKM